jgi:hypothetical protein
MSNDGMTVNTTSDSGPFKVPAWNLPSEIEENPNRHVMKNTAKKKYLCPELRMNI